MLKVVNFSVSIDDKEILHNVSFKIDKGNLNVLMGPNGSGKSTLGFALCGHPGYKTDKTSKIILAKKNIINSSPDKRARAGLFLGFQNPITVPGVNFTNFLRQSYPVKSSPLEFYRYLKDKAKLLKIPEEFLSRNLNDQFSGGEKKKMEMLQALVLKPKYAILDEPDTGTDVDSLKLIALSIKNLQQQGTGILLITHYQRLLKFLEPDRVYILKEGQITASGGKELIKKVEDGGYGSF